MKLMKGTRTKKTMKTMMEKRSAESFPLLPSTISSLSKQVVSDYSEEYVKDEDDGNNKGRKEISQVLSSLPVSDSFLLETVGPRHRNI